MFKKILIVLMIGCFLLGWATKAEVENVEAEAEKGNVELSREAYQAEFGTFGPITSAEEPALYKRDLNPVTPKSGITTGHVIFYGHYIKPPYKLEIREDTLLFLNGINLDKRLVSRVTAEKMKREDRKSDYLRKKYSEFYEEQDKMYNNKIANNLYNRVYKKQGQEAAIDSLYDYYERHTLVISEVEITPKGEKTVEVVLGFNLLNENANGEVKYTDIPKILNFKVKSKVPENAVKIIPRSVTGSLFETKEQRLEFKKSAKKMAKENCEITLNRCRVLYYSYSSETGFSEEEFIKMIKILRSTDLSFESKVEELKAFLLSELEAKDILYNFDPEVWPEIDEEGNLK